MCECVKAPGIVAGWKCCACGVGQYNGLQRDRCRNCHSLRCKPLAPDVDTGEQFESYEEAYADDPRTLAAINEAIASHVRAASIGEA